MEAALENKHWDVVQQLIKVGRIQHNYVSCVLA